jgi:hypothetical protein
MLLTVVPYECVCWSLALGEEHGLKASGNEVLRRIFGPKIDEVKEGWRIMRSLICPLRQI